MEKGSITHGHYKLLQKIFKSLDLVQCLNIVKRYTQQMEKTEECKEFGNYMFFSRFRFQFNQIFPV